MGDIRFGVSVRGRGDPYLYFGGRVCPGGIEIEKFVGCWWVAACLTVGNG